MGTGEGPPARRENGGRRRRWLDGGDDDDDDDEEYVAEEEEEEDLAEELPASSAGEEGEDSDAEYQEEEEDDEDEDEVETPRPKRPVKPADRGRKGKADPAAARSRRSKYEEDDDYEEEVEEDDEVEEYNDELEEIEEEEEEAPPRPKSLAKSGGRGRNGKPSAPVERSHQRSQAADEEDADFDPELDDDDDEPDEDIDFDPEVDEDEEDEFEDEEEEESVRARARGRKVTIKSSVKRKSVPKKRSRKKTKKSSRSKVSKRKASSAKARKSASVRRRRKRSVDDYEDEDDDEDDNDFIVEDEVLVSRRPRKKARTGSEKETEVSPQVSVAEEETWPNLDDTSESEFLTSDEEPMTPVAEPIKIKKGRKKRASNSESSSDSEFHVSDKELEDLGENDLPKAPPMLPIQRRISVLRSVEDKGKRKEEPEEAGKPICGICLSEEQRTTVQGVLNCCSHYFCFACIMEWSRVESRCPLCKQRFTTITKSSKVDLGLGQRKAIIKVEERDQVYQPTEEEIRRWLDPYENVVCIECNQGGDDSLMLLCDICDSSAHTYCVGLGREVPEGNWYCGGCRLSDEGPSYSRIQRTVGSERQSYRNHVDGSSVGFGTTAPSGTFERSPSINARRSFQGIDLNLSPREFPGETHPAESQVSTDSVSTPTGGRATVSGRRQIHRYIRILLTRPRAPSRPDGRQHTAHSSGAPRTEPNRRNFHSSSEANTSQILPDVIQNQHNGLPFVQAHSSFPPCISHDGDDFQQMEGVKSNLRNL